MLTQLTHDIATMSRRRWLAATAGLSKAEVHVAS